MVLAENVPSTTRTQYVRFLRFPSGGVYMNGDKWLFLGCLLFAFSRAGFGFSTLSYHMYTTGARNVGRCVVYFWRVIPSITINLITLDMEQIAVGQNVV